jgi:hypothetical protein
MPCCREIALAWTLLCAVSPARAADIVVEAVNASTPTQCAETDNVYVILQSGNVTRFTIEAEHPSYLKSLSTENKAPDFTNCDMSGDAAFRFTPREVTLYDRGKWRLRGFVFPNFWRASHVPVRVGNRVKSGLHLLQLWTRDRKRNEEVLVLYPADGYWRARPLAPLRLPWKLDPLLPTAYGSSFLIGPVEMAGRPFVDISAVTFDPKHGLFRLALARGGKATVRVKALDRRRIALDAELSKPVVTSPFAALRSMYVAPDNADVSRVRWRAADRDRSGEAGVMAFDRAQVTELWAGRAVRSRHNNTAPDMIFRNFRARR